MRVFPFNQPFFRWRELAQLRQVRGFRRSKPQLSRYLLASSFALFAWSASSIDEKAWRVVMQTLNQLKFYLRE
jgi:hypothetical protein